MFHFPHFAAMDMDGNQLTSSIKNASVDYVLVDFYAPWCPHCQHFAPEYERLALTIARFNNATKSRALPRDPRILSATVDCVRFEAACNAWGIDSYPTLLWGSRADWISPTPKSKVRVVEVTQATAEAVALWIDGQTHLSLDPRQVSRAEVMKLLHASAVEQPHAASRVPPVAQKKLGGVADRWDMQLGAALLLHNAMRQLVLEASETGKLDGARRQSLLDLVELLRRRFPDEGSQGNCQKSLEVLGRELSVDTQGTNLTMLEEDPASYRFSPDLVERNWTFCATEWAKYGRQGWRSCKGTLPGKRGFTCGLWTLFHAVAARSEDSSAAHDLSVMRGVIANFFECEECRKHFLTLPVAAADTASRKATQLWWWRTHNLVNSRVQGLEAQYDDGDPAFPKVQWPTEAECPKCRRASSFLTTGRTNNESTWNLDEVVLFLDRYYGK